MSLLELIPTLIDYSMQGFVKFGFYENSNHLYKKILGVKAQKYHPLPSFSNASKTS
jgi:hypothetical protein